MPVFHFAMTEEERQDTARVLGRLVSVLVNGNPTNAAASPSFGSPATAKSPALKYSQASPPDKGNAPPSVEHPRDRWARDREGKEIPQPNAEAYTVRIWKCEQGVGTAGNQFLDVRWEHRRAYCHDPRLFPWILAAVKSHSQIILYLKLQNNFDTIVGVKS